MSHFDFDEKEGGPAARFTEFPVGAIAWYQFGQHIIPGEVLDVRDGDGGQLVVVENNLTGFPEIVLARELFGNYFRK